MIRLFAATLVLWSAAAAFADDVKQTPLYGRIKAGLDAIPAIDTHDHLRPFGQLPNLDDTDRGRGMTLHSIFAGSYLGGINRLSPLARGQVV